MWKIIAKLRPSVLFVRKTLYFGCVTGIAGAAFFWGRHGASQTRPSAQPMDVPGYTPTSAGDYGRRVAAYIYGNIPITREDFGEYLIARFGQDRIDALINRKIIEKACHDNGVYVTDAEVNAQLGEDLRALGKGGITIRDFEAKILRPYNKTLFEWREDVLRPQLALTKLARPYVKVENEDVSKLFEARYGPMVKCRMIVMPKEWRNQWFAICEEVRASEEAFRKRAREQFMEAFKSKEGEAPPVHKHFGDDKIEKAAFGLQIGEVSGVIELPDQTAVILRCEGFIPARTDVNFDKERVALYQDVYKLKLNQKIPEIMKALRDRAKPIDYIRNQVRQDELERAALKELNPQQHLVPMPSTQLPPTSVQPASYTPPPAGTAGTPNQSNAAPTREPIVPPGQYQLPAPPPTSALPPPTKDGYAPVPVTSGLNLPTSPSTGLPIVPTPPPSGISPIGDGNR